MIATNNFKIQKEHYFYTSKPSPMSEVPSMKIKADLKSLKHSDNLFYSATKYLRGSKMFYGTDVYMTFYSRKRFS